MRDIISEVVKELTKEKTLENGWGRDCPSDRGERGLIELWVAMVNKVRSKYMADMDVLESKVDDLREQLSKCHAEINDLTKRLHERTHEKVAVGIGAHIDRLGDRIGSDETTRLLSDVAV